MNYVLVTLQKIAWVSKALGTSGTTWAYSNRKPQNPVNFFGDKNTSFQVSRQKKGVAFTVASDEMCTVWLSVWDDQKKVNVSITDEEAELYRVEYGEECYVDDEDNLITLDQHAEIVSNDSTSTEDSEQPFAE